MAVSTGFITIADVSDGNAGFQAIIANENQTFAAGQNGAITNFTFSSTTQAFAGLTALTYASTNSPTSAQYSISDGTNAGGVAITASAGANLSFAVNTQGVITITDDSTASTGFADAGTITNVVISVPFRVRGVGGAFIQINRSITLTKAMGGSAEFITVASSTQTITYDNASNTPQATNGNIVFSSNAPNIATGTTAWSFFAGNPSATSTFTPIGSTTGVAAGTTTTTSSLTVTPAQYQTARGTTATQVVYRATRSGAIDQVSVVRLQDARSGANAANVVIAVTAGSSVFRNNTGTATLRADLYINGAIVTPSGTTYVWSMDGTPVAGGTNRTLSVAASDIADDGASLYSCAVTFPDASLL